MRYLPFSFPKWSLTRGIVLAIAVLLGLTQIGNGLFVWRVWAAADASAASDRRAKASILAEHASRSIGAVDQVLEILVEKVGSHPQFGKRSIFIHMMLRDYAAKLPQLRAITATNAAGMLIYDSRSWPDGYVDVSDRAYFTEQKRWRGADLYIDGLLMSRVDGLPFFALSRPLLDSNGNFLGVVNATASPEYFSQFYDGAQLGSGGAAVLAREDGRILAVSDSGHPNSEFVGSTVSGFLARHPGLVPSTRRVPGLPLQIVVITPGALATPGLRALLEMDIFMAAALTVIAALLGRMLVVEARMREQREQELQKSEQAEHAARKNAEAADQAKADFLANMSHELRTPLNAIIGFAEIISTKLFGPSDARYIEYGELISKSGTHLLGLINDILDISKLRAGKLKLNREAVDIRNLIESALEFLAPEARRKSIDLSCGLDSCSALVFADPMRLRQIVLNLVSNAVKFTPEGGAVSVRWFPGGDHLTVEVHDTGIGMKVDEIPKALEPFEQIKTGLTVTHEGTGLGLPLSKSLVQAHGGTFEIESEPGIGTTVRFTLPALVEPALAAA